MKKFDNLYKTASSLVLSVLFLLVVNACQRENDNNFISQNSNQNVVNPSLSLETKRPLSPKFMCFNVNSVRIESWQDKDLVKNVSLLNPRMLRLPGGEVANYWDWQRGGLIEDTSNLPGGLPQFLRYQARKNTSSKLEDFKTALDSTGTSSLFVLNMLTSDLKSQIQMLEKAKKIGIPVEYIELGNEFYFNIKNYNTVFPTPRSYAQTANQWITAIKQKFPDVKTAVVGAIPIPQRSGRLQNWNKAILSPVLQNAEAITLHLYWENGLNSSSSTPFINEEIPIVLGEPFRNWQSLQTDPNFQNIQNKKIWITEYNLRETKPDNHNQEQPKVAGTWAHGLYSAAMSMVFLEDSRIELICNHLLAGHPHFAAVINKKAQGIPTSFNLSAAGSALSLLGDATEEMTSAQKINFSEKYLLKGKNNFEYSSLYGWVFSNAKSQKGIILNLSPQPLKIDVSPLFTQPMNYEQISGNPLSSNVNADILMDNKGAVSGTLSLPPYSITKFSP
ncbi:MAG TPA: hypothetical protein V6D13_07470 [Halomicronema sp.]